MHILRYVQRASTGRRAGRAAQTCSKVWCDDHGSATGSSQRLRVKVEQICRISSAGERTAEKKQEQRDWGEPNLATMARISVVPSHALTQVVPGIPRHARRRSGGPSAKISTPTHPPPTLLPHTVPFATHHYPTSHPSKKTWCAEARGLCRWGMNQTRQRRCEHLLVTRNVLWKDRRWRRMRSCNLSENCSGLHQKLKET